MQKAILLFLNTNCDLKILIKYYNLSYKNLKQKNRSFLWVNEVSIVLRYYKPITESRYCRILRIILVFLNYIKIFKYKIEIVKKYKFNKSQNLLFAF